MNFAGAARPLDPDGLAVAAFTAANRLPAMPPTDKALYAALVERLAF